MNKIKKLRKFFRSFMIDGYLVPKNDEYFNEYVSPHKDRLKFISNFSGSAGFGILTMKKNYLFVDGRYTLQAKKESGKNFQIKNIQDLFKINLGRKKAATIFTISILNSGIFNRNCKPFFFILFLM